eukprot:3483016-Amphidinium_carterae.1
MGTGLILDPLRGWRVVATLQVGQSLSALWKVWQWCLCHTECIGVIKTTIRNSEQVLVQGSETHELHNCNPEPTPSCNS